MKKHPSPPCLTCRNRAWRPIAGFTVLGCAIRSLRFGIAPDLARGHVNAAGGCVAMPRECRERVKGEVKGEG